MSKKSKDEDLKMFLDAIENITESAIQSAKVKDTPPKEGKNKKDQNRLFEIDLHGQTVSQAKALIKQYIEKLSQKYAGQIIKIRIITGKGRHSGPQGSPLSHEAHAYVKHLLSQKIVSISESPASVKINNLPIRGHFDVSFKA